MNIELTIVGQIVVDDKGNLLLEPREQRTDLARARARVCVGVCAGVNTKSERKANTNSSTLESQSESTHLHINTGPKRQWQ